MENAQKETQEHDRILAEMAEANIVEVLAKVKKHVRKFIHEYFMSPPLKFR